MVENEHIIIVDILHSFKNSAAAIVHCHHRNRVAAPSSSTIGDVPIRTTPSLSHIAMQTQIYTLPDEPEHYEWKSIRIGQ